MPAANDVENSTLEYQMDVSGSMRTTCLEAREKESNLTDYRIVYMPNVLQNVLFLGEFFFFFYMRVSQLFMPFAEENYYLHRSLKVNIQHTPDQFKSYTWIVLNVCTYLPIASQFEQNKLLHSANWVDSKCFSSSSYMFRIFGAQKNSLA